MNKNSNSGFCKNKNWKNLKKELKRERLNTISNMIVMSITFILLGVFIYIVVISQTALKYLESQAQITIFFKDETTEEQIKAYETTLQNDTRVSAVSYVSKEDALRIFKEINKDEPILLESISASILPASLEVKTKNITDLRSVAGEYREAEGVEEVRFFEDVVARFRVWSLVAYIVGFVLVVLFLVTSFSVVVSTLRTTINSKGVELEILKLVGASDAYVKTPLLYQGVFFGMSSSIIASFLMILFGVIFLGSGFFPQGLSLGLIPGLFINPVLFSVILSFILILSGFLLGYYGSNAAIKRYLKY